MTTTERTALIYALTRQGLTVLAKLADAKLLDDAADELCRLNSNELHRDRELETKRIGGQR